jgi:hypothetical protein
MKRFKKGVIMKISGFLLVLISLLLSACGGGGGSSNTPSAPAAPVYTYNKISEAGAGTTFDEVAMAWLHQPNYYGWVSGSSNTPLDLSVDSDFNTVVSFDTTSIFDADSPFRLSWEVVDDENPQPASNVLDDYAAWTEVNGTVKDLVNLTEVGFRLEAYSFFIETGTTFLGTEYVFPMILFNDHGSDYQYGVGSSSDTLLQLEVIANVFGDKTEAGDMPVSGSSDYSSKGIAAAHLGWSYGGAAPYNARKIDYLMGVESDSTLVVDHGAGTVSGTVTFDYAFQKGMFAGVELGITLGSVSFDGQISGTKVVGTATWANGGEGTFSGSFYGPNADEFGGVLRLEHSVEGDFGVDLIVASIVASK